ncbi:MAG: isochorismate-pyruvate lyase [Cyanobacteria bacterium P01_G01_bin.67]
MSNKREIQYQNIKYEIARLDRQIIVNLAQRCRYMQLEKSTPYEKNKSVAINNFKLMLDQRKSWAIKAGLSPDLIYKLTQYLIDYYLTEEEYIHKQSFGND